ncbi:MAG TPA: enoyl-CoA hydratase [Geobacteraceae bacterium]
MQKNLIESDLRDGIFTMRFNRPEKKNALSLAMYTALVEGLREADGDDSVRVVLLTGVDGCFTSGNDLADFMVAPSTGAESPVMLFLRALSQFRKPIVAAVTGTAVGVGVTMLLHCDLVYAGAGAVFQLPFVNLGLCPEAGSTLLFPMIMGHQRAAELLLLGEPFTAEKACAVGIVNAVAPDNEVLARAREKSLHLTAQPPAAVRLAKALLKRDYAAPLQATIAEEGKEFMGRLKSPEAGEALQAFRERRKPDFAAFV